MARDWIRGWADHEAPIMLVRLPGLRHPPRVSLLRYRRFLLLRERHRHRGHWRSSNGKRPQRLAPTRGNQLR